MLHSYVKDQLKIVVLTKDMNEDLKI